MPLRLPDKLPAIELLKQENIFVMDNSRATSQDIRPLRIVILNLMPLKITTETDLVRLLSNTPLQMEIYFMKLKSHTSKNTPIEHMMMFYKDFDVLKNEKFDGMIITGAPIEHLEFEDVGYWDEITRVFEWAVHFNDINSFYPTLLALTVAMAATFYSSIQLFAPDVWRHFYFHPSLNPFSLPPILAIFIASVWAMIVMAIATIDDVYHKLPFAHATLYMCGLGAVCAANYIIFSVSTLYYIGYVLLVAYMAIGIRRYAKNNYYPYVCGNCGARLRHKGVCDNCGAINS
jgi:hypothetical protein